MGLVRSAWPIVSARFGNGRRQDGAPHGRKHDLDIHMTPTKERILRVSTGVSCAGDHGMMRPPSPGVPRAAPIAPSSAVITLGFGLLRNTKLALISATIKPTAK